MADVTPRLRIAEVRLCLRELDGITGQTARRFDEVLGRFELFAQRAFETELLSDLTAEQVEQFVKAKPASGELSTATMHLRRSVLRVLFRVARERFGFDGDPTLDLELPPRSLLHTRPLTNDEVAVGRSYAMHTLTDTRQPAAWALVEATATTAELPHITLDDIDVENKRVWLHGSRKRDARWGDLDEWGVVQLDRRAQSLRNTRHLIYRGNGSEESQQASCCIAIKQTMIRAGLDSEPDVRPASLAAWAGRKLFDEGTPLDVVAQRLGIRSLDAAARFIAFDWRD